ncbi:penicillin acylase family protein [bacterium]|nr:penicillin acylase family protein [bacterium]
MVKGLKEDVEVVYDKWGILHIFLKNGEVVYRPLSLIYVQDRPFQMDLLRRLGSAELPRFSEKVWQQ